MSNDGQISPDGLWRWDGTAWLPTEQQQHQQSQEPQPQPESGDQGGPWESVSFLFSTKIKASKHERIYSKVIGPHLHAGERVLFITKCSQFKPMTDLLAVTTRRVLTSDSSRVVTDFPLGEPLDVQSDPAKERIEVKGAGARHVVFKIVPKDDHPAFMSALAWARQNFTPETAVTEGRADIVRAEGPGAVQHSGDASVAKARPEEMLWPRTQVVGARLGKKASLAIGRQCHGDEPWLILVSSGGAGLLTAFEDRMVIIKTGLLTSAMAGSLGGERAASFHFRDITGLEYNSGFVNGVLEVLTASYNGTANRDYWRGSNSGRNANADDPWTLSNTLPLGKPEYGALLVHINELRKRISASKNQTVQVSLPEGFGVPSPAAPAAASLTDELRNLGELHAQGILTDEEFVAAKMRLLSP